MGLIQNCTKFRGDFRRDPVKQLQKAQAVFLGFLPGFLLGDVFRNFEKSMEFTVTGSQRDAFV